jgi:hypothetical protein
MKALKDKFDYIRTESNKNCDYTFTTIDKLSFVIWNIAFWCNPILVIAVGMDILLASQLMTGVSFLMFMYWLVKYIVWKNT